MADRNIRDFFFASFLWELAFDFPLSIPFISQEFDCTKQLLCDFEVYVAI